MTNVYQVDTTIQLSCAFTVLANGNAIDPTTVNLFVQDPLGNKSEYNSSSGVTRNGTGLFSFELTVATPGTWTYKWQGQGNAEVTSPDTTFYVAPTTFNPLP